MEIIRQTKDELETLLRDTESERVERKESWSGDAADKGRQAICAFANDLPGYGLPGVLFVGADDRGKPTGLPITDELLRTLSDIKTDGNILPQPALSVEKRETCGREVAVVTVLPSDAPPVRYKGRIWIRTGPKRSIASAQEERILNERRKSNDLPFDLQRLNACDANELNRVLFSEEYLPNAFAPDVLESNERSYSERLASCRMIASADNPIPTVLGVLVLSDTPSDWVAGAYVQFLRIDGKDLADPISDDRTFDAPLTELVRAMDEKMASHNRIAVDFSKSSVETRSPDYPMVALQQFTRNAIMHRTYESTSSPVRVYWFNDRIEIHSPGGPYGIVNADNFGRPGYTDYRNPHLAESMKVLGYVQKFGVGIATAQRALRENKNGDAEFEIQPNMILVTIHRATK